MVYKIDLLTVGRHHILGAGAQIRRQPPHRGEQVVQRHANAPAKQKNLVSETSSSAPLTEAPLTLRACSQTYDRACREGPDEEDLTWS